MTTTRTCDRCGDTVTSPNAEYRYCKVCFYTGNGHHAEAYAGLLEAFETLPNVTRARIQHTGGGCFGIGISLTDGRFGFLTDAYREPDGSMWCDATLDNGPEGLSYLSLWPNEEDFDEGESDCEVYGTGAEIVAWIAAR
jgi:hypothetical protein